MQQGVNLLKGLIMTEDISEKKQRDTELWYREVHKWISEIHFAQDEMDFVKKLLNSDVYEDKTPNLFERLQEYLGLVASFEGELEDFESDLLRYENELGTFLELIVPNDAELKSRHLELGQNLGVILGKFRMLKSEIFQYTGGILRKRRSSS